MGFNFGFFGSNEHRVFNYKPRYYNPEKEALKEKFGAVDGTNEKTGEKYVPGSYLKGSFREGNYQRTRQVGRMQKIIGMVTLILIFAVLILIAKFYGLIYN
ncbi:MAG: hypothetical protein ACI3ZQ_00705 [Candidatus Cryptobacteroides sp.]